MNTNMPRRLVDSLTLAPKKALYENFQKAGIRDAKPCRTPEWAALRADGVLVVTLWDVQIARGPNDTAVCTMPVRAWVEDATGAARTRAQRLEQLLEGFVGKSVAAILCEHTRSEAEGTKVRKSVIDIPRWGVEPAVDGVYRLVRLDSYAKELTEMTKAA